MNDIEYSLLDEGFDPDIIKKWLECNHKWKEAYTANMPFLSVRNEKESYDSSTNVRFEKGNICTKCNIKEIVYKKFILNTNQ
ncbi:MAG: hypothetical protein ACW98K_18535 [Candidatus Kariarchaeaceae archaeon]|jgi:hypothetical protein